MRVNLRNGWTATWDGRAWTVNYYWQPTAHIITGPVGRVKAFDLLLHSSWDTVTDGGR